MGREDLREDRLLVLAGERADHRDDGVVLTVYRSGQGWLVSDEGSTIAHLADGGAATEAPAFADAWQSLARPNGFTPGDDADTWTIAAWCDDAALGQTLHDVATAAVRAEGLIHLREAAEVSVLVPVNDVRELDGALAERIERYPLAATTLPAG
ncbi:hypothetical protein [Actinomyces gaoshouyii]|uniref:hypothetical protein n=1 Tax=Actinomyces gaoshouyii TaxID=1960083 RepID=UPI0013DDBF65|nr:hypothetical protein [Actinomyces gaoshouyii]